MLDETAYTDLSLDYDTDRCINVVNLKLRRVNVANGQTVEVSYGPFTNQDSVDQWGPHSAEFTVQGIEDSTSAAQTYANGVLAANATPAIRINSVTLPIRTPADLTSGKALLDLYDLVSVQNTNAAVDNDMRVTGLKHTLTPDKWLLELDFTVDNSVAIPTRAPVLPGSDGAPGAQGPQGPPGTSAQSVDFTITTASTTWTLNHNFGIRTVNVTTFLPDGTVTHGDVDYPSANTAVVTWYRPMTGTATVST